jgi:hypothetical protein
LWRHRVARTIRERDIHAAVCVACTAGKLRETACCDEPRTRAAGAFGRAGRRRSEPRHEPPRSRAVGAWARYAVRLERSLVDQVGPLPACVRQSLLFGGQT